MNYSEQGQGSFMLLKKYENKFNMRVHPTYAEKIKYSNSFETWPNFLNK